MFKFDKRRQRGFSIIELLVVAAIFLVVATIAFPITMNAIESFQMRSSANAFADVLHTARMRSVRNNATYAVREVEAADAEDGSWSFYVDLDGDEALDDGEKLITMYKGVSRVDADYPDVTTMGFEGALLTDWPPRFNSRGLPCILEDGVCTTFPDSGGVVGFVYFITNQDEDKWVAISISPSGRINTWTWGAGSETWVR